ncbi:FAD/NAD(P)-binding domain-containing protein [Viridothelium virens]|uniref:FAD/NAD(P)-binding domain-containing protein n=1 Tax=Viridothelium virens TaxID=1048519 RepID=A0A6A6H6K2_VIRVR|nr:FAD/NAD(P)-binding domain-containing protein [Viridothelium virens]
MDPTVLIVGAGTFGISTAYHLAHRYNDASRITIIDRSSSPPKPAASVDINRIIRTDYPDSLYCNLASEAIHPWFWSMELGHYFHKTGWVMMDERGSDLAKRIRNVFQNRGSTQTGEISLEQLDKRWAFLKGTETGGIGDVYWNPEAGWCDAAKATASFMEAAERRGVKRVNAKVTELLLDTEHGRIEGIRTIDGQRYTADKVVLAVGAWTSSMLSPIEDQLEIAERHRVELQVKATGTVSAYYKLSDEEFERLSKANMPIIVYGSQGEVIPPSSRDGSKYLKYNNSQTTVINTVTTKSGHRISIPADRSQNDVPNGIKRETERRLLSKLLPEFTNGKQAEFWRICWDAVTPSEDLLLCKHPHAKLSNLYLATGGSFHGYKFLPIVGKYMANVLNGQGNGREKDHAWGWKSDVNANLRGFGALGLKMAPKRELRDFESDRANL